MAGSWRICALYHFTELSDPDALRDRLEALARAGGVRGTLILAREGINGTIAAAGDGLEPLLSLLANDGRFAGMETKFAVSEAPPFKRLKVRCKAEIVTLGRETDPARERGRYVESADWDALLARPDVTLVDVRNDFEVAMGTFEGALEPATPDFGAFPDWAEANLPADRDAPVAMFCTGGIRCEKASSWLARQGYRNVLHLRGGILRYLEEVEESEATKWRGSCFVFDERVGVGFGLQETGHTVCRSCRTPLDAADRAHEDYHAEISCPHCAASLRPAARARRVERLEQARRADARGIAHIGADLAAERARKGAERREQRRRSLAGRRGHGSRGG